MAQLTYVIPHCYKVSLVLFSDKLEKGTWKMVPWELKYGGRLCCEFDIHDINGTFICSCTSKKDGETNRCRSQKKVTKQIILCVKKKLQAMG